MIAAQPRRARGSRREGPAEPAWPAAVESWLNTGWAPGVLGVVSAVAVALVWGSSSSLPAVHDESSYLLQARLFAAGKWSARPLPHPEFFEQFHVLVTPRVASKYFPGHALVLAPGVLLGLPGLVPVVLTAVSGALLFALARRFAGAWVGLLTWLVWIAAPDNLQWRASYFSETTTGAAILASWWLLADWRERRRTPALLGVAALYGLAAVTRPLTALAFALPVGVVVLQGTLSRRAWAPLAGAAALGAACLAVVPVWSARTTGDWRLTPHSLYTRQYMPWDRLGFGWDATAPARALPAEMRQVVGDFESVHRQHVVEMLPAALIARVVCVLLGAFAGLGLVLLPFALVSPALARGEGRFATVSGLALLGVYLPYAHPARWTLYYLEALPVLAFATAAAVAVVARRLSTSRRWPRAPNPRSVLAGCAGLLLAQLPFSLLAAREVIVMRQDHPRRVAAQLGSLPEDERALVFFRFAPDHSAHLGAVANNDDPWRSRVLLARDRGADNARLVAAMPDRRPYVLDEASWSLSPWEAK